MAVEKAVPAIRWFVRILGNPLAATTATFVFVSVLSLINQSWWSNLLVIVSSYLLADLLAKLVIEVNEGYLKIFPRYKETFNTKGHGYLVYFSVIVAGTVFAGIASKQVVREFLLSDLSIYTLLGVNLLLVLAVLLDLEIQFSRT